MGDWSFESVAAGAVAFLRAHPGWAEAIAAAFVLGESIAFLSLAVPGTAVLVAAGAMAGAGLIDFATLAALCVPACLIGDGITFAAGRALGPRATEVWPFRSRPALVARGERFVARWGVWGVLFSRFFGPIRAFAPLSAAALGMPARAFAAASVASAPVYVAGVAGPAALATQGLGLDDLALTRLGLATLGVAAAGGAVWLALRLRASDRNGS